MENKLQLPTEYYLEIDRLDDAQIVAEIQNQSVATWAYRYIAGGNEITGLSKKGVDQACSVLMGKYKRYFEEKLEYALDPISKEHILFEAQVTEITYALVRNPNDPEKSTSQRLTLSTQIGTKRQWVKMALKSGKVVDDKFWFEKGSMKAIRNAKVRFISPDVEAEIIAEAMKTGRVENVEFKNGAASEAKIVLERGKVIVEITKKLGYESREDVIWEIQRAIPEFKEFKTLAEIIKDEERYNICRVHFNKLYDDMARFESESLESETN